MEMTGGRIALKRTDTKAAGRGKRYSYSPILIGRPTRVVSTVRCLSSHSLVGLMAGSSGSLTAGF